MRILSALFDSYDEAASAVRSLKDAGIPADDISLVANNAKGLIKEETRSHSETNAPTGAVLGAATGAGVGLLAGLGALAVPGIGPVVAAGWLLSTAVGAALGATSGGILGALLKAGVTEDDAHVYAEGIRRGGTLLQAAKGVDIKARRQEYASEGWKRVDETAEPYTPVTSRVSSAGETRI